MSLRHKFGVFVLFPLLFFSFPLSAQEPEAEETDAFVADEKMLEERINELHIDIEDVEKEISGKGGNAPSNPEQKPEQRWVLDPKGGDPYRKPVIKMNEESQVGSWNEQEVTKDSLNRLHKTWEDLVEGRYTKGEIEKNIASTAEEISKIKSAMQDYNARFESETKKFRLQVLLFRNSLGTERAWLMLGLWEQKFADFQTEREDLMRKMNYNQIYLDLNKDALVRMSSTRK